MFDPHLACCCRCSHLVRDIASVCSLSANSVICLPHLTPSYSEGAVAGEEQGIGQRATNTAGTQNALARRMTASAFVHSSSLTFLACVPLCCVCATAAVCW